MSDCIKIETDKSTIPEDGFGFCYIGMNISKSYSIIELLLKEINVLLIDQIFLVAKICIIKQQFFFS